MTDKFTDVEIYRYWLNNPAHYSVSPLVSYQARVDKYITRIAREAGMVIDACGIRAGRGIPRTEDNPYCYRMTDGKHTIWFNFIYSACFFLFNEDAPEKLNDKEKTGELDEIPRLRGNKYITCGPFYIDKSPVKKVAGEANFLKLFTRKGKENESNP